MCEEFDSFHDRSGRLDKVMGQSIVLREIKAEVPLENDDSAYQNFLLQRYEERVQKLSQQGKVSKGTGEQFHAVACREYTLPRDDGSSQPKGWTQEIRKLDPCWKLRPVVCMVNMESRLDFGI